MRHFKKEDYDEIQNTIWEGKVDFVHHLTASRSNASGDGPKYRCTFKNQAPFPKGMVVVEVKEKDLYSREDFMDENEENDQIAEKNDVEEEVESPVAESKASVAPPVSVPPIYIGGKLIPSHLAIVTTKKNKYTWTLQSVHNATVNENNATIVENRVSKEGDEVFRCQFNFPHRAWLDTSGLSSSADGNHQLIEIIAACFSEEEMDIYKKNYFESDTRSQEITEKNFKDYFFTFIGVILVITCNHHKLMDLNEFFRERKSETTELNSLFPPPPNLSSYMSENIFWSFYKNIAGKAVSDDRFQHVRTMCGTFSTSALRHVTLPQYLIGDECIAQFYGRYQDKSAYEAHKYEPNVAPPAVVIDSKPRGRGWWICLMAIYLSKVSSVPYLIYAEARDAPSEDRVEDKNKGKNCQMAIRFLNFLENQIENPKKPQYKRHKKFHCFLFDSYYASVECALSFANRGYGFLGAVKQNSADFPKEAGLELLKNEGRGAYAVWRTEIDGKMLYACAWKKTKEKCHFFIEHECGQGFAPSAKPLLFRRHDPETGEITYKRVKVPDALTIWHKYFGAVDQSNRIHQGIVEFWKTFRTSSFEKRTLMTILGIKISNLYSIYLYDSKTKIGHTDKSFLEFAKLFSVEFLHFSPKWKSNTN